MPSLCGSKRAQPEAASPAALVAAQPVQKTTVQIAASGKEHALESLDKQQPLPGGRHQVGFVTWSHPTKEKGYYKAPENVTKAGFAQILAECWGKTRQVNTPTLEVIIFEEEHGSGKKHYHAMATKSSTD